MNGSSVLKSSIFKILQALIVSLLVLSAVILFGEWQGISIGYLTRDIASIAKVPFYAGLLSQIGIFFWVAAATLCFFAARMISKKQLLRDFRSFLY